MSLLYSANQFNEPFKPSYLKNWTNPNKGSYPGAYPKCRNPDRPIKFIAENNGRLLPAIRKKVKTSPWGVGGTIWEISPKKKGIKKERESLIPSYLKSKLKHEDNMEVESVPRPECNYDFGDPIQQYLREENLLIIWFIGLPTPKTANCWKIIQKSLVAKYGFTIIALDKCIQDWIIRFNEQKSFNQRGKRKIDKQPDKLISVELELSDEVAQTIEPLLSSRKSKLPFHSNKTNGQAVIEFSLNKKLSSEKIIQLLKYAMIEKLPTNGFIIDCFPCDLNDALLFEQMIYEVKMGIYFGDRMKYKTRSSEVGKLIYGESIKAKTKNFSRDIEFSQIEADNLCQFYSKKILRISPEKANSPTLVSKLVSILIEKNLNSSRSELTGFTLADLERVNYYSTASSERPESMVCSDNKQQPVSRSRLMSSLFCDSEITPIYPVSKRTVYSKPNLNPARKSSQIHYQKVQSGKTYTISIGTGSLAPSTYKSGTCDTAISSWQNQFSDSSNSFLNLFESNSEATTAASGKHFSKYPKQRTKLTPAIAITPHSSSSTALSDPGAGPLTRNRERKSVQWNPPKSWTTTTCSASETNIERTSRNFHTEIRSRDKDNNKGKAPGEGDIQLQDYPSSALKHNSPESSAKSGGGDYSTTPFESQSQSDRSRKSTPRNTNPYINYTNDFE